MVTLSKIGASYNRAIAYLEGLSSETKPTVTFIEYDDNGIIIKETYLHNGSIYTEIDTGKSYMYDVDNSTWHEVSMGGGGGGSGLNLVGVTTTQLSEGSTTNPITINGQSYTAQADDMAIYGYQEFYFDGTYWHEFGDYSGLGTAAYKNVPTSGDAATTEVVMGDDSRLTDARNAADVSAWAKEANKPSYIGSEIPLTGYEQASSKQNVAASDSINAAIGKVEYRVGQNETNISSLQEKTSSMGTAGTNYITVNGIRIYVSSTAPTGDIPDGSVGLGF